MTSNANVSKEIITSTWNAVSCKDHKFRICIPTFAEMKWSASKWEWYTKEIILPIIIDADTMPFRVPIEILRWSKCINVTIAKKHCVPRVFLQVRNFGFLPKLFSLGTLHAVLNVHLGPLNLKTEPLEILYSEEDGEEIAEVEVDISNADLEYLDDNIQAGIKTGDFTVDIFWKISFLEMQKSFLKTIMSNPSTEGTESPEEVVDLVADTGKRFPISKRRLRDFSGGFRNIFEKDHSNKYKAYLSKKKVMSEDTLRAFRNFLRRFSLVDAMKSCSVAVDLLIAGHFYKIPQMKQVMQNIILAKPAEWFDMAPSVLLYCYASKMTLAFDNENEGNVWKDLQWKASPSMRTGYYSKEFEVYAEQLIKRMTDTPPMSNNNIWRVSVEKAFEKTKKRIQRESEDLEKTEQVKKCIVDALAYGIL